MTLEDRIALLESRVQGLELENVELTNQLEAVTNELAYIDAYQENQQMDHEDLAAYVFEMEDVLDEVADVVLVEDEMYSTHNRNIEGYGV